MAKAMNMSLEPAGQENEEKWWQSEGETDEDDEKAAAPDPFFDPGMDDQDAEWAEKQRSGRQSDAILSCPSCFTTLCIDCQQHHKYHGQYRAMFVMNCKADFAQVMQAPASTTSQQAQAQGRGKKRGSKAEASATSLAGEHLHAAGAQVAAIERYHPVSCDVCDTEVGVRDAEGLYHFFHVFPSNA